MKVDNLKSNDDTVIVCNKCNENIKKNVHNYFDDFLEVEKRWGYHSSFDNEVHKFILCEKCYKELIDTFSIKIIKK